MARAPRWLFSRDLVGSGYVETYTAANGSQVTEQLQRQVGPQCSCLGPAAGAGAGRGEPGLGVGSSHPPPAGPLLLPGPRGGAPALGRQPKHLCRPQVGAAGQTPLTLQSERGPGGRGQPGAAVGSLGPQTQGHARLCPRGFFQAGPAVRLIEPLAEAGEEGPHALYLAQHLQQEAGTCGVNDSSLESILGPRVSAAFRPRVSGGPTPLAALLGPERPQTAGCSAGRGGPAPGSAPQQQSPHPRRLPQR